MAPHDPLQEFFERPLAPPEDAVLRALQRPIAVHQALPLADKDRLLDPAPMRAETGWCVMGDGVGYVAVRTPMPGTSAAMWDWWFDWQRRDPRRYRVWYPPAHFGITYIPSAVPRAKPYWGAIHYPDEDIGMGREVLRIDFMSPSELGFCSDALARPHVGTIVGGLTGSPKRHLQHSVMTHVFLEESDGLVLRSRFWIGSVLRPYIRGAAGDALGRVINRRAVRMRLPFRRAAEKLAHHCAAEYARLAPMLPDIYERFASR
ncbi:MAG TPA: hypothetical protein VMB91_00065 [Solirubrobacteraceae bacterium]|nr:hypothetical protein [Solirubrobacteraceae bacterium]